MPDPRHEMTDRSIASLFKDLSSEALALVREEILLARTEIARKVSLFQHSALVAGMGAVLLMAGVIVLVTAANRGLTVLLASWFGVELAVWLAPLMLGVLLAALGLALLRKEIARVNREGLKPKQTLETLEEDSRWLQEKVS
jgi:hypothetical protein